MERLFVLVLLLCALVPPICGQSRIVGGRVTPNNRARFMVSILVRLSHSCGGVIITRRTVLTAAHCVQGVRPRNMLIRAGSNLRNRGGYVGRVSGWRRHPRYRSRGIGYDVGLVYLRDIIPFGDRIQPIPLFVGRLPNFQRAVIFGWGTVRENGPSTAYLKSAAIRIMPRRICRRAYGRSLRPTAFCAGYIQGGVDACQGDSGGPLVIQGRVAGIVSDGYGCGERGFPGIYTTVSLVARWIRRFVQR